MSRPQNKSRRDRHGVPVVSQPGRKRWLWLTAVLVLLLIIAVTTASYLVRQGTTSVPVAGTIPGGMSDVDPISIHSAEKAEQDLTVAPLQTGFGQKHVTFAEPGEASDLKLVPTNSAEKVGQDLAVMSLQTMSAKKLERAEKFGLDPRQTGWSTEVVAEQAKTKLKKLAGLLSKNADLSVKSVTDLVSADFRCGPLRPVELVDLFSGPSITVREVAKSSTESEPPAGSPLTRQGAGGLVLAMEQLATPLAGADDVHVHVKIIDITLADTDNLEKEVQTTSLFEASGQTLSGLVQERATWSCQWRWDGRDSIRLVALESQDYQEVKTGGPWLSDCTHSALGHNDSFHEQLKYGLNHWLNRIEKFRGMSLFSRYGMAMGDVNGDGLEDIYVCQPAGIPNRLYVGQPDGTANDRSAEAGVDWLDPTVSALFVDLDNDGDQDLVSVTGVGLLALENDSTGRFKSGVRLPLVNADFQSLSAIDYDQDGDLDLYICVDYANAIPRGEEPQVGFVYHDANDGGPNRLLRNDINTSEDGSWKFTDVTEETGLDAQNRRHSLAAAWEDYDNDGDPDLYVANDYGQNCLYQNDGGRFVNVADDTGVVDYGSGMSVSWADFNRDGRVDLYVGNMFSSAGNRVTRQAQFKTGKDKRLQAIYRRFAKGNSLFVNLEDGGFCDVGGEAAVEMGRWAWSSVFADLNNDGWEDLLVANGYITTEDTGDL